MMTQKRCLRVAVNAAEGHGRTRAGHGWVVRALATAPAGTLVLWSLVHTGTAERLRSPRAAPSGACTLLIAAKTVFGLLTCPRVGLGKDAYGSGWADERFELPLMSM